MSGFFYICEYLNISPQEFFDDASEQPEDLRKLIENLKQLDLQQLRCISIIVEGLVRNK